MSDVYVAFRYIKMDGEVVAKKFFGEDAVRKAEDDGWKDSPAHFLDDETAKLIGDDAAVDALKDGAVNLAHDANILANAMASDDISDLKNTYRRFTGKSMPKRMRKLETVQTECLRVVEES